MRSGGNIQGAGDEPPSAEGPAPASSHTPVAASDSRQGQHGQVVSRSVSPPARRSGAEEGHAGVYSLRIVLTAIER